jgi:predicted transposase YbfD/YdcC
MKTIPQHTIRLQDGSLCNFNKRIAKQAKPLVAFLSEISDPRDTQGRRHSLILILLIVFIAFLRGSKDLKDAHLFALHARKFFKKYISMPHGIPDPTTISRVLQELDPEQMIKAFVSFLQTLHIPLGDIFSFDGKTMRAVTGKETIRHMLTFFSHTTNLALGQIGVSTKENEIPAFDRLLSQIARSIPVEGILFLGDALHTQKETVRAILKKRADYLFVVKGNQKELFQAISLAFSEEEAMINIYHAQNKSSFIKDSFTATENRRKRSMTTAVILTHDKKLISYIKETYGWEGIQTVGILKRTGTRASKDGTVTQINETVCFISSRILTAKQVVVHLRGHWCIENNLHWTKDVIFLEDKQTVRLGNAPQIMSFLRSMCISIFNVCKFKSISDAIHNFEKSPTLHSQFLRMAAII